MSTTDRDHPSEELLAALVEAGRAEWPDVPLSPEVLRQQLAHRIDVTVDAATGHAGDLFLACACAAGLPGAIAAFERHYLSQVQRFVARISADPDFLDELRQVLRERLLVGSGGAPPRIGNYSGRGPLAGWLRITAVRTAIDLRGQRDGLPLDDDLGARLGAEGGAELALLRTRYLAEFQQALEEALRVLTARERMLLRLYAVNGMTIDEIGAIYQVHRASVSRWLTAARARVSDETRRLLRERLRLSPTDLQGLMAAMRSQLHISLPRMLGPG